MVYANSTHIFVLLISLDTPSNNVPLHRRHRVMSQKRRLWVLHTFWAPVAGSSRDSNRKIIEKNGTWIAYKHSTLECCTILFKTRLIIDHRCVSPKNDMQNSEFVALSSLVLLLPTVGCLCIFGSGAASHEKNAVPIRIATPFIPTRF